MSWKLGLRHPGQYPFSCLWGLLCHRGEAETRYMESWDPHGVCCPGDLVKKAKVFDPIKPLKLVVF